MCIRDRHYTISGVVSGTENLVKTGPGTVTVAGTSANTYVGTVTVEQGSLMLGKPAGLNAVTGGLVIGDDAGTDGVTLLANNQIANAATVTVNANATLD